MEYMLSESRQLPFDNCSFDGLTEVVDDLLVFKDSSYTVPASSLSKLCEVGDSVYGYILRS